MARPTIDANVVAMRYAEEVLDTPGTLPGSPVWYDAAPRAFGSFGARITSKSSEVFSSDRQVLKGNVVDLEAEGTFTSELFPTINQRLRQGMMYADIIERPTTSPLNIAQAAAVAASIVLTATGNPSDGDTVTLGTQTYTFRATPDDPDEIDIGGTASDSLDNLIAAVTGGAGEGTAYGTGTLENADVTAAAGSGDTVLVTALIAGVSGNSIAVAEASTVLAFAGGATALSGGLDSSAVTITAVDAGADTFAAVNGLERFLVNALVKGVGFTNAANNALHLVSAETPTLLTVASSLVSETPPSGAALHMVGYQFATGTLDVTMSGNIATLTRASGSFDFTTLGLQPGDRIYIGGDSAGLRFATAANRGFAQVASVTATTITLRMTAQAFSNETGTGLTVQIFFGNTLKNASTSADVVRRTFQLEGQLGPDDDGTMSEYLVGSVPNRWTVNMPGQDLITEEFQFIARDHEARTGLEGLKSGDRPTLASEGSYNTVSDARFIRLALRDETTSTPDTLAAYVISQTMVVDNGAGARKAHGTLGAIDVGLDKFRVTSNAEVYFANVATLDAVRAADDVSVERAFVRQNQGLFFDLLQCTVGTEGVSRQQNAAIQLPVTFTAAKDENLNTTMILTQFIYLPSLAAA